MNTKTRGKKKKDIITKVANIWNERLIELIKKKIGSQKAFADAYKERYGTGNAADVSRWVNVGTNAVKDEVIGFPSYDTMRRIADFFGVTVGYLTGETDYDTFEMEQACEYLGIDQSAGNAILRITKLRGATRFEKYEKINYGRALCQLLSAERMEEFIGGLCQYAEAAYRQDHPVDYMNSPKILSINPGALDLALKYKDEHFEEEDIPAEVTPEVVAAIHALEEAENKGYIQPFVLERDVKVAKYELQERYFHLIEEVLRPEKLESIQSHYYETAESVKELKQRIDSAGID